MALLKATFLLFDMDGTIVDSRLVVEAVLRKFAKKYQLDAEQVIAYAHGKRSIDTVCHFIGHNDAALQEVQLIDNEERITLTGITSMAGAKAILDSLGPDNWALVTSAGKELACNRMTAAGLPMPHITVFAEDVQHGKPSPEGYLLAAQKKGIAISECVVFEDAYAGIQAGIASGAKKVIAVNGFTDVSGLDVIELAQLTQLNISVSNNELILSY